MKEGQKDCRSQRDVRLQRHVPLNLLSRAHMGSQRWKWQTQSLCGSAPGPLSICYGLYLGIFVGRLPVAMDMSLTLLPVHETLILLFVCIVQLQYEDFSFVILYLGLSYLVVS